MVFQDDHHEVIELIESMLVFPGPLRTQAILTAHQGSPATLSLHEAVPGWLRCTRQSPAPHIPRGQEHAARSALPPH